MTNRTGRTPDQIYKTTIEASAQDVWDAITNPEFTRQYWFGNANVSADWKKGSAWEHLSTDGHVYHTGKVLESDPPRRLVLSWHNPGDDTDVSRVTYEIAAKGNGVELTIIHGDFIDGSPMAARVVNGWPKVVAGMKEMMEQTGEKYKSARGC